MTHEKSSCGPKGVSLKFSIKEGPNPFQWAGISEKSADDLLLNLTGTASEKQTPKDEAIEWLLGALADGPREVKQLVAEAQDALGISRATVYRAREECRNYIVARKDKNDRYKWLWEMKKNKNLRRIDSDTAETSETVETDETAETGTLKKEDNIILFSQLKPNQSHKSQ